MKRDMKKNNTVRRKILEYEGLAFVEGYHPDLPYLYWRESKYVLLKDYINELSAVDVRTVYFGNLDTKVYIEPLQSALTWEDLETLHKILGEFDISYTIKMEDCGNVIGYGLLISKDIIND